MKILYLDCGMGAAGDMLTAALLESLPDPDELFRGTAKAYEDHLCSTPFRFTNSDFSAMISVAIYNVIMP